MEIAVQLMLGVGLAASAGLRAWAPLLVVSLLAHGGYLELHASFAWLGRQDAALVFGVATLMEVLGDKLPAVDHFLDAVGAVVRPAAGTVLAAAMFTRLDPLAATVLGLVVGGSTAFAVTGGKTVARAASTAAVPVHGGMGNALLSTPEDGVTAVCLWMVAHAPLLAAILALLLAALGTWLMVRFVKAGGNLLARLRGRRATPRAAAPQP